MNPHAKLTPEELANFVTYPEEELVEVAIDLEIPVGESIVLEDMLAMIVERLANLAVTEGLPLSQYDADDINALPEEHCKALMLAMGKKKSVSALIKTGQKIYKNYNKRKNSSPIPMVCPMLLGPVSRVLYHLQNQ